MNKTNGQIAYEAYCNHTGWKSLVSGQPLPQWQELKHEIAAAWECAGRAVHDADEAKFNQWLNSVSYP